MEKLKLIRGWKTLLLLVCMSLFSATIFAQGTTLRGKVVDQKGEPLIGAKVAVTASPATGTATNITGDFTLRVPAGTNKITISYIGYVSLDLNITPGKSDLGQITLAQDQTNLSEVVVVGYGTLKRADVTGTVTTIDNKVLQEIPASNVFQQIQGRVAGLDVTPQANGTTAITIRGNRTIANTGADGPLIVVDGAPFGNDINNINPNDIKSVDVLKGASATAIYGSRGSGGVILITTNRGRVGQTVTAYDAYYTINTLEGELKMLNGTQYNQLKYDGVEGGYLQAGNQSPQPAYPLTAIEQQALAAGISTDYVKLLEHNAYTFNQDLRVSGGTDRTQFNVGIGYRRSTGLESSEITSNRVRLNASIDHKINNIIKFGLNIDESLNLNNSGVGGQFGTAQWLSPLSYPYNPDGSVNPTPLVGQLDASTRSPLLARTMPDAFYNFTRGFVSNNILYAQIDPIKHLSYRYTVNYNFSQSLQGIYNGINGVDIVTIAKTSATTNNNYSYRVYQEHTLTYDNTIAQKHHINFVAAFENEKVHNENSGANVLGIPEDANKNSNLGLGTFNQFVNNAWNETGLISYIARLNYVYAGKYDLTGTFRSDGNSTLAAGHQWTRYPSIGLGWVISNESFMQKYNNVIDNLKLRAGWGQTSNNAGANSAYQTLGALSTSTYAYGGGGAGDAKGVRVANLVNTNLTWQTTAEYNIALDFALFKSRLTGNIEVYQQKTTGIILPNFLPATLGSNQQPSNLGASSDRGIELTLSSINIQNKGGFSWNTDFNIGFNRERIDALPNGATAIIGSGEFVGQPLSVIYDLKKIGIWQLSDATQTNSTVINPQTNKPYLISTAVKGQTSPLQYPGQVRVQDLNGDGKIDANDNQFVGHFNPNYTFGMTNRFSYKNFDLSIVIQARMGFTTVVPYVASANSNIQGWQYLNLGRHNQPYIPYWTPATPNNPFPEPNDLAQSQFQSTLQYFDGSFIRAKSINLGYNIPSNLLKHIGVASLRVYANVTNPFFIYAPVRNHGFYVPDAESIGGLSTNTQVVGPSSNGNIAGAGNIYGLQAGEQTRDFLFGINARF
ncbi:MAG: SusC/RagA family TonB-linked outer membrane protein [Mucilaginibacter sp.]